MNREKPTYQDLEEKIICLETEMEKIKAVNEQAGKEDKFRSFAAHVPCTVYLCLNNPTFDMIFLNDYVEKLTGYPKEEFLSHKISFVDLYHADDKAKIFQEADLSHKSTFKLIYRIWHKDGSLRWVEEQGCLIHIDHHAFLEGFILDITERIKFEEALQERESYLSSFIENQPGLVWLKDQKNRFLAVNKSFAKSCGLLVPERLVGKTDFDIWPGDLAEKYHADDVKVMTSKKATIVEEQILDQGEIRWFETFKTPVFDAEGRVIGTTGYSRDVTERKRIEDALKESEEIFNQFMNTSPIHVFFKDEKMRSIRLSRNYEKMLGKPLSELLGKTMDEIFPSDFAKKIVRDDMRILREGKQITLDEDFNGRHYTTIKFPIHIEGRPSYLAGYTIDITERKQAEAALHNVQKLESLGILAGGIAHDFNNLLGGVFGYIDLARIESSPQIQDNFLLSAMNAIDRARALTQQLLTFAKGGAPVKKIERLVPFLQETVQFALSGSSVSCRFDIQENLRACEFDKNQIGQVIDNIIINAQQAMPGGGEIEVSVSNISLNDGASSVLKAGHYVKFSVRDHGIGIPREFLPRIFDPFFTTKPKGHGLGLATCFSIITRHEGSIEVESEPGKGSTFHVFLPASSEESLRTEEKKSELHKGSGTFVVMDDEELLRATLGRMLEAFGYKVILTEEGKNAVDFFKAEMASNRKVDGMIFDLTIPGRMGGKEAVLEIRKLCSQTPVFVSSGYADDPVMANPREYGFTASICKPFKLDEFSRMLNEYMGK